MMASIVWRKDRAQVFVDEMKKRKKRDDGER